MKTLYRGAMLTLGCVSLSACATVVRGPNTDWHVATSPPGATVQTSNGLSCSPTPCSLHIFRKSAFTATITKPGYKPVTVDVSHGISTEGGVIFLGNALIGGLIGAAVDLSTGAVEDLSPRQVDLPLEQQGSAFGAPLAYVPVPTSARPYAPLAYAAPSSAENAYRSEPARASGPTVDGRVFYLKVLPDHSVQEAHEPSPAGQ